MADEVVRVLDETTTDIGRLQLRHRHIGWLGGIEAHEMLLDGKVLMTDLLTESEEALARIALGQLADHHLDVVVGGLGLGHTAAAVLDDDKVRSVLVVEAVGPVIGWHSRLLLPLSSRVTGDSRCRIVQGDFFRLAGSTNGFDSFMPKKKYHAVLLDIDDSPTGLLHSRHRHFYRRRSLRRLARHLHPDAIFGLWTSDSAANEAFAANLRSVFSSVDIQHVQYVNPARGNRPSVHTLYFARFPHRRWRLRAHAGGTR